MLFQVHPELLKAATNFWFHYGNLPNYKWQEKSRFIVTEQQPNKGIAHARLAATVKRTALT